MPPTRAERKQLDGAVSAFHSHYSSSSNWGPERWTKSLYPALARPTRYALLMNRFAPRSEVDAVIQRAASWISSVSEDLRQVQLPSLKTLSTDVNLGEESTFATPGLDLLEKPLGGRDGETVKPSETSKSSTTSTTPVIPFLFPAPAPVPVRGDSSQTVMSHWNMDAASALAVYMLDVKPNDRVLDLCAAPGGKSVALAQLVFSNVYADTAVTREQASGWQRTTGCLDANEIDQSRNKHLAQNLRAYLPRQLFTNGNIRVLRIDGSDPRAIQQLASGGGGRGAYDKVLLDAPCSSERHVIHAYEKASASGRISEEMSRWRPGTSKNLAKTQAALLLTALKAVKIRGRVLYSTCSIENGENDGVIEKLRTNVEKERKKLGFQWSFRVEFGRQAEMGRHEAIDDQEASDDRRAAASLDQMTEQTEYGRIALPDHDGGGQWGPLYFCLLTKTAHVGD